MPELLGIKVYLSEAFLKFRYVIIISDRSILDPLPSVVCNVYVRFFDHMILRALFFMDVVIPVYVTERENQQKPMLSFY